MSRNPRHPLKTSRETVTKIVSRSPSNPVVLIFFFSLAAAGFLLETDLLPVAASPPRNRFSAKVDTPSRANQKRLDLSKHYQKAIDLQGLLVVGSSQVSDFALLEAAYLVDSMLANRSDIRKAMARNRTRVAVMAPSEMTTDLPEHSDLTPKGYWDKRARGLGATRTRPAVSCGEENLLEYKGDPYRGENILVHEFAHAVHRMGLDTIDPSFDRRLTELFESAMKKGLWQGFYAATDPGEYWAEGVQSWFDCNRKPDASHNHVDTREELIEYDPGLASLIESTLRNKEWRYAPPSRRSDSENAHLRGYDPNRSPTFAWPQAVLDAFTEWQRQQEKKR